MIERKRGDSVDVKDCDGSRAVTKFRSGQTISNPHTVHRWLPLLIRVATRPGTWVELTFSPPDQTRP